MKTYSEKITFPSSAGDILAASLELPATPPRAYAIFAHCFTCSKDYIAASWIARSLAREEIAVLRFDFTGLGNSQGDFANTNFSSNVEDLMSAAAFLRDNYAAPEIMVGHSLGGTASIVAASKLPEVKAVATVNAPHNPANIRRHLLAAEDEINKKGEAIVNLAGRPFKIKKQFLDDISSHNMDEILRNLNKPLMIFHSPVDNIVDIDSAVKLFTTARHPKSFVSLDTSDHLLTRKEDADFVGRTLAAWALRYVSGEAATQPDLTTDRKVVVQTGKTGYTSYASAGGHPLISDEPVAYGGRDLGPSPYDLLLTALGACTTMTLRMYADRKQWPLEKVKAHLNHNKIHAQDCQDCESKSGKLDRIEREIELFGPLDEQQRQRLLEIADRCPVHRTMHSEIVVETKLRSESTEPQ